MLFLHPFLEGRFLVSFFVLVISIVLDLGIPVFLMNLSRLFGSSLVLLELLTLSAMLFYGFTTVVIFLRVIRAPRVTSDTASGAIVVYLMIGLFWATAYAFVEALWPGSFYISEIHNPSGAPLRLS